MGQNNVCNFLPGLDKHIPRKNKLKDWMESNGWTYLKLAKLWECHWTFPGKCLNAETEELPADRRQWLIDNGFPEELLPPLWSDRQKKKHNQIRAERKRDIRIKSKAQEFREQREKAKAGATQK